MGEEEIEGRAVRGSGDKFREAVTQGAGDDELRGAIGERTVRNQEPKWRQTKVGWRAARHWRRPWATRPIWMWRALGPAIKRRRKRRRSNLKPSNSRSSAITARLLERRDREQARVYVRPRNHFTALHRKLEVEEPISLRAVCRESHFTARAGAVAGEAKAVFRHVCGPLLHVGRSGRAVALAPSRQCRPRLAQFSGEVCPTAGALL